MYKIEFHYLIENNLFKIKFNHLIEMNTLQIQSELFCSEINRDGVKILLILRKIKRYSVWSLVFSPRYSTEINTFLSIFN